MTNEQTPVQEQPTQETARHAGEIEDNAIYEWGILIKDAHTTGTVDTAPFSPVKIGNWQGGSLSWTGAMFRTGNKRAVKTFADFQRLNAGNLPTNKTFFFFRVTVDADGVRKKQLVHEGAFSERKAKNHTEVRRAANGYVASAGSLSDAAAPIIHTSSGEARSLRESMDRTISDLQRELDVCRRERDMLRDQVERLRAEVDQNRTTIINIEGERIRHSVEREALEQRYKADLERMHEDHEREIMRMEDEFARDLADAKQSAEKAAIQTLNDGAPASDRIIGMVQKVLDNEQLMGLVQMFAPAVMNKIAAAQGMAMPQGGIGMQQQQQQGMYGTNPFEQQVVIPPPPQYPQPEYTTAEPQR